MNPTEHPHGQLPLATAQDDAMALAPSEASAGMVLVHGRGAGAADILLLGKELLTGYAGEHRWTRVAPQAAGHSWYPYSFLAPRDKNQPGIHSGLRRIGEALEELQAAGIPAEKTVLAGFSQGACLTAEFAARHPCRYGAVLVFTGGLIGPVGMNWDALDGDLAGTPVFLGASDRDPHVPRERVAETAAVLERLGAEVDERIYPGMGHTINADEIEAARDLVGRL